ncbi:nucleotidyltransferase family protein [Aquirufa ecclesiirivi]|uniref:nucleotidyltransferase family protein n=1 Tax=Aquirufa ecclesiirivi TaxID=2715124 RepID=UPI0022A8AA54|nr:nucleotidyltransferase family protein [Aquirufa ecclesiirivi]MCZ2472806.1 nucleotidyltransferase family protein [Aquirufa ecclesiirivi]
MKKDFSPELDILIQAITNQFEQEGFAPIFPNLTYDSDRLSKLYRYHGIQALIFSYERKEIFMAESIRTEVKLFMAQQVVKNLQYAAETTRLLKLFSEHQIPLLVLKGNILIQGIYQNKQVRTTSDLDVLIEKKHLIQGLEILLQDGYRINSPNLSHLHNLPEVLKELIVNQSLHNEIHLQKGIINLDFHWDLFQHFFYQKYQEKKPLINRVFDLTEKLKFNGIETQQLNSEGLFWMLLAHHGGKESWFRLRHIQDFHAFMYQYDKKINWELIILQVDDFRLTAAFKNALSILKLYLDYKLPSILDNYLDNFDCSKIDLIVKEWEKASYWGSNRALTLRHLYLTTQFQDKDFAYIKHIIVYLKYFKSLKRMDHYPNTYSFTGFLNSSFLLIKRLIKKE